MSNPNPAYDETEPNVLPEDPDTELEESLEELGEEEKKQEKPDAEDLLNHESF